ncbi:MAG: hypothetical protein LUD51_08015 [Clostridia bacterium]|nr:hypothetical protein [Clostridia bacterium]
MSWAFENHGYFLYDITDSVKQYEMMKAIKDNNAQVTVSLNRALPVCSPDGTCMIYITTLCMPDDWAKVSPENYY